MLVVETIARIRRDHLVKGVPIKKIARDLRVSKNTVRKVVRGDETSFSYARKIQPMPKLGPWVDDNSTQAPTAPGAPTALMADGSSETQIDLSWTAPADNGGATISGYRIEVSADGGTTWTDLVANTGTTSVTFSHTGLTRGSTRHYRVSAINATGTGAASDPTSATTPLSTNVTLSGLALKDAADDSSIDLNETFAAATKFYTADVATDVDEITVEPTSDHNATFAYLNDSNTALTDADTNTTGFQAALAVGANTVKVKVTAEDGSANETYSVVVTRAAAGNAAATGKPSITGAAQAGMTLEAGLGDIADADGLPTTGYMYQWISEGSAILGATGSSLTLGTSNYNGQKFRVRVSFTDGAGHSESRTSDETRPVAPAATACPTDTATVWCARLTVGHSVPGPVAQGQQAPAPLAAGFVSVPPEHDGQTEFWLELSFGAAVEQGSKQRIQALLREGVRPRSPMTWARLRDMRPSRSR